jgi:Fuc2NAc and GlcNAc transferase
MRSETAQVLTAALTALAISAALTAAVRRLALRHGLLDLPNQRSSHSVPTPRGGGIAIVIASGIALTLLATEGATAPGVTAAILGGGLAVAMVGFIDDRRRLSASVRLVVHAAAAVWALLVLGGVPAVQLGDKLVGFGWAGWVIGTLGIVWVLNLYNFMDGIDGIAATEAVFVVAAGALLSLHSDTGLLTSRAAIVFGAACLGFLGWNWAPAKIFMGDVGSGYLGYVIAVLALASAHDNSTALLSWLILGGVFFCDATVTLIRRMLRGERLSQAHRCHAYQWLARRWHSHSSVTLAVMAINLLWLLPCALFATAHPPLAGWTTVVALAPLTALVLFTGAGRCET